MAGDRRWLRAGQEWILPASLCPQVSLHTQHLCAGIAGALRIGSSHLAYVEQIIPASTARVNVNVNVSASWRKILGLQLLLFSLSEDFNF